MSFIAFNPVLHTNYVRSVLTVPISQVTRGIISLDKDGAPGAVILFDGWTHNAACMHIAVQKPMQLRGLMKEAAEYLFNTCKLKMLIGIVESTHTKALKLDMNIGFKELYRIKDCYADGVDQIILQLKKEDCKYLPKEERLREVA